MRTVQDYTTKTGQGGTRHVVQQESGDGRYKQSTVTEQNVTQGKNGYSSYSYKETKTQNTSGGGGLSSYQGGQNGSRVVTTSTNERYVSSGKSDDRANPQAEELEEEFRPTPADGPPLGPAESGSVEAEVEAEPPTSHPQPPPT